MPFDVAGASKREPASEEQRPFSGRAPGIWAAGNVADPRAQVITSAGAGSAAAIAINADLVQEDVALAVEHFVSADAQPVQ